MKNSPAKPANVGWLLAMVMSSKPREAPRLLNTTAKKKPEPAERIRQLMESIQGGGGGGETGQKTHTFADRQSTQSSDSTTSRVVGQAAESPTTSVTDDSRRREPERRLRGINQAHFLSNDGMRVIDDEPEEEEKVRALLMCVPLGYLYKSEVVRRGVLFLDVSKHFKSDLM